MDFLLPHGKGWKKEKELFNRLVKETWVPFDNNIMAQQIGRKYKPLINKGYFDIGHIEKKQKSFLLRNKDVIVVPRKNKFFFYKIF